jgi:hypothetical protein
MDGQIATDKRVAIKQAFLRRRVRALKNSLFQYVLDHLQEFFSCGPEIYGFQPGHGRYLPACVAPFVRNVFLSGLCAVCLDVPPKLF